MLKKLFGKKLQEIRCKHNLTQEDFAELCGMETHSIGMIECGLRGTTFTKVELFAEKLNVDYKDFFDFNQDYVVNDTENEQIRLINKEIKNLDKETLKHIVSYIKSVKTLLKKQK